MFKIMRNWIVLWVLVIGASVIGLSEAVAHDSSLVPPPPPPPPPAYPTYSVPVLPSPYPTMSYYPPPPMPTYSYPAPPPPSFKYPVPSAQMSPTHPAYIGAPPPGKTLPRSEIKPVATPDPEWIRRMKKFETRFMGYQKELDRILARHDNKWASLMKTPEDRKKCEEILRKWRADEVQLVGSLVTPSVSKVPIPPATRPDEEELNASDLDD